MSASGRRRWSQWYRWIFRAGVYTGSIWFCICSRSGRTMPASGGFPHSPGQPGFHFPAGSVSAPAPAGTPHCHRRCCIKRIRQAAALRSGQFTGGSFNSDEWCEAPRLINRLDAAPVVGIVVSRSPSQPYQVTCEFRDSDIQPVRSRSRRHTRFATLRPSGS